jgi:hypothetical protein
MGASIVAGSKASDTDRALACTSVTEIGAVIGAVVIATEPLNDFIAGWPH